MVAVNGIRLHFVHELSPHPGAIPLLFLHGWPGSFFECHKIIRKLARPGRDLLLRASHHPGARSAAHLVQSDAL